MGVVTVAEGLWLRPGFDVFPLLSLEAAQQ